MDIEYFEVEYLEKNKEKEILRFTSCIYEKDSEDFFLFVVSRVIEYYSQKWVGNTFPNQLFNIAGYKDFSTHVSDFASSGYFENPIECYFDEDFKIEIHVKENADSIPKFINDKFGIDTNSCNDPKILQELPIEIQDFCYSTDKFNRNEVMEYIEPLIIKNDFFRGLINADASEIVRIIKNNDKLNISTHDIEFKDHFYNAQRTKDFRTLFKMLNVIAAEHDERWRKIIKKSLEDYPLEGFDLLP